jgi:hypothetical protein
VRAPLLHIALMSLTCASGKSLASPWSTQPLIGLVGQYSSNPALLQDAQSETNAAVILNLPVNYDMDNFHFVATPAVRYGNASGYSSLTSDYYHFNTSAQYADELGSLTATALVNRDSSLLFAGEVENGVGVRRDTSSADVQWQRLLTERDQFQLDLYGVRTLYAQNDAQELITSLVDYRYYTIAPAIAFALSERSTFRVIGSVGKYEAVNGVTSSDSANLQLGFDRQLSELWSIKTTAGYSKSTDKQKFIFDGQVLGTLETTQNSTIYSANLIRQGESLTLNLGASRALAPTGYAFLSRQENVNLHANYIYSERWTYSASINWANNSNPLSNGGSIDSRYYYGLVSANWSWTEHWILSLRAIKAAQRYGDPAINAQSTGVSFEISRQFSRAEL